MSETSIGHDGESGLVAQQPAFALFWDFYGLFLRTTRERQGEAVVAEWKRSKKRKNIPRAARAEIMVKLAPTSLFQEAV
jgi:hypothetical protein